MKNENKCFFSISLENGITITGANPNDVKTFLTDLQLSLNDAIDNKENKKYQSWVKYLIDLKRQLNDAWITIDNNQQK